MSAVITGKNFLVTEMDRYNKYQTKQYTHAHTSTLHTQQLVATTWLSDHQGKPTAPLIRCVKPSKYGALTDTLELQLEPGNDPLTDDVRKMAVTVVFIITG